MPVLGVHVPKVKKITPFHPRAFPPRNLKKESFSVLLQKANKAIKKCNLTSKIPSSLLKSEAFHSLESQKTDVKWIPLQTQNYLEAFQYASKEIIESPLSKKMICKIHKILKKNTAPKSSLGNYRTRQNWIGPKGCKIEEAYFCPPEANKVEKLMEHLIKYTQKSTKEPLLQLALIFAQLLIIHPFMDGNGRVARILVPIFLYKKKVIPSPCIFLSGYFQKHRLKYMQTLLKTTKENNWECWIVFFLKGIIETTTTMQKMKFKKKASEKFFSEA